LMNALQARLSRGAFCFYVHSPNFHLH
jgi:hypothetical protein